VTTSPNSLERVDLGEIPYREAADLMRGWVLERQEDRAGDRLFLLSHPPVITYSARTPPDELPPASTTLSLVEVDRGGFATYHGPGQLVGYLVVDVRHTGPADVVRWLEDGIVEALRSLGFDALRRDTPRGSPSLVGVWTPEHHKVASIGMRIRRGVTSHGFALNVAPDLAVFRSFTACAMEDVTMTSLAEIGRRRGVRIPTDGEVRDAVAAALGATRGTTQGVRPDSGHRDGSITR
jgi:lipoate-protein ligase B